MPVTIDMAAVEDMIQRILTWGETRIDEPLKKGATNLKQRLQDNISTGRDINGKYYQAIDPVTLAMPIKWGNQFHDLRIRGEVSRSPKAMSVTGQTKSDIEVSKLGPNTYGVGYSDERTEVILLSNAKSKSKPTRDPVGLSERNPSEQELDIVADEIEKALGELLNGF